MYEPYLGLLCHGKYYYSLIRQIRSGAGFSGWRPLVLIGTSDRMGKLILRPSIWLHPWAGDNYFGFVCTPSIQLIKISGTKRCLPSTYVRPTQLLLSSLAASPRCEEDPDKSILSMFQTVPASNVDALFLQTDMFF